MNREVLSQITDRERFSHAGEFARDIATRALSLPFSVTYIRFRKPRTDLHINAPSRGGKHAVIRTNENGLIRAITLPGDTSVAISLEEIGPKLVVEDFKDPALRGGPYAAVTYGSFNPNLEDNGRFRPVGGRKIIIHESDLYLPGYEISITHIGTTNPKDQEITSIEE